MGRLLLASALALCALAQKPPPTRTDNVREVIHGVEIVDPYRWLENQDSPETRRWIDAQNAYSRPILEKLPGRARIAKRLSELMDIDEAAAPHVRGGRYFFARRLAGRQQPVIYMREGLNGRDQVLIDPAPLSPDHTASVTLLDISDDGKLVAYGIRRGGEDEVTVRLLDVDTRKELADELPRGRYGISILPGRSGFYYSRFEKAGPRVYFHAIGKSASADTVVFGEGYGPEKGISARVSENGRYLLIQVSEGSAGDRSEIWVQDLKRGTPPAPIVKGLQGRFTGRIGGDMLYLATNWEAPNGRVLAVDLRNPARERWRVVVPEGPDAIDEFSAAAGRLFVSYLRNASSTLAVFTPEGKRLPDLPLPGIGSVSAVNGTWSGREAFFEFDSFHTPVTILRYDAGTGKQDVWWSPNVRIDRGKLELKQVWYSSKDGTRIPMFLLHRKGLKLDGNNPVFLTGYGGFDISLTPAYSPTAVLWAENGGVFAQPNLRGGGEFGQQWHRAGMLEKKQNVFDDFFAAAEWLIRNGYTKPQRLAISGRSNGGLLMGAAITQRPELFGAVVCGYPLLDMLRYDQFLVARWWVPEYGSASDPAQFKYLYAYSPYHRVRRGAKYPAVLFVTGDADTRVAPLHARKMTALLQASTGSDRPILLRYDTKAGHSRGMPIGKRIEDLTEELAFLYWQLGVNP
ncbi:MAG TPA: prolyl oligopeptidase family serine peptidase [Bryobacteraceae bacterium]|nr:prolyl oligopeptidase family serine peptidase [Bryobacteraceae bacterium]HPQ15955.1 prolyl oligopeptidase family serine peptidase [Bryobacteraceae bacterium]HPU72754.1 prolyl oligopeptidase family serine peptidase [Bryobacteraceae bacterium]